MRLERVEPLGPQTPVGGEPGVHLEQRLGHEPIPAPLGVDADVHEVRVAQHSEVLGDAGLAELEVFDELADRAVSLPKEVEDRSPRGFGQDGEAHPAKIPE